MTRMKLSIARKPRACSICARLFDFHQQYCSNGFGLVCRNKRDCRGRIEATRQQVILSTSERKQQAQ